MKVTGATGTAPTAAMASTIWSTSLREMVGISGIVTSSCDETTKVVGGTSLTATAALTGTSARRGERRGQRTSHAKSLKLGDQQLEIGAQDAQALGALGEPERALDG